MKEKVEKTEKGSPCIRSKKKEKKEKERATTSTKKERARAKIPSLEMIRKYMESHWKEASFTAERFRSYYEERGWRGWDGRASPHGLRGFAARAHTPPGAAGAAIPWGAVRQELIWKP